MKNAHPIRINTGRSNLEPGGRWEKLDTFAKGKVQILRCRNETEQAAACVAELLRLKQLDMRFEWQQCVVLARTCG